MFLGKNHEQTIIEISQRDYISAVADSFLIDRQESVKHHGLTKSITCAA